MYLESTHIIHVAPLFRLRLRAGNSSEPSEEPLGYGINEVYGRLICQLWLTCGNVEAQEVLYSDEIGGFNSAAQLAFFDRFFIRKG